MSAIEVGSPTIAYEYASALLQHVRAIVAATDGGDVDVAFVSPGIPSFECETIAVWGSSLGYLTRTPAGTVDGGHRLVDARIPLFGFTVAIVRCTPVSRDPNSADQPLPDQYDARAQIVLQDAWAVWNGIVELFAAGSLFGGRCHELFMDSCTALEPRGGLGGWQLVLRAALPGYIPGS